MAKVLIAGCGDVGIKLAYLLVEEGHRVVAIKRNPPAASDIDWIAADLRDTSPWPPLRDDFDAFYYLPTPSERSEQGYRDIFLLGLENILQKLPVTAARGFCCLVSSTAVYGQSDGAWVDEQSATNPKRYNGQVLLEAEQQLLQKTRHGCCVRLAGIYGPGRERLLQRVKRGEAVQKRPPRYTNRIHGVDAARLLKFLLEQFLMQRPLGSCYLGVDSNPAPIWDVHSWIAAQLSVSIQAQQRPSDQQNKRCCNQRILTAGFEFLYPSYQHGYAQMLGLT